MRHNIRSFLGRFRREEDGNTTIEFVILVPIVFNILLASVELGLISVRQMFLDRGVDMAVRNVRFNTGQNLSHTDLTKSVCDYAGFLEQCDSRLSLSLNPVDLRTYTGPTGGPSRCTHSSQPLSPLRNFIHGGEHQVMLIVACYESRVLFPFSKLAINQDDNGILMQYGFSGFVQEPS